MTNKSDKTIGSIESDLNDDKYLVIRISDMKVMNEDLIYSSCDARELAFDLTLKEPGVSFGVFQSDGIYKYVSEG